MLRLFNYGPDCPLTTSITEKDYNQITLLNGLTRQD